jgi:hypothetical protein
LEGEEKLIASIFAGEVEAAGWNSTNEADSVGEG